MSKPVVYLAGPIQGMTYAEAQDWKRPFVGRLWSFIQFRDPMRGKKALKGFDKLQGPYDYLGGFFEAKSIVGRDMHDVRMCDAVLAYCPGVSAGTLVEIGWATALQKPVIMLVPQVDNPLGQHPFFRGLPGVYIAHTVTEAIAALKSIVLGV